MLTEEALTDVRVQYEQWQRKRPQLNRQSKSSLVSMKRRLKRNDSDGAEGYDRAGRNAHRLLASAPTNVTLGAQTPPFGNA
jgi:hypothetical protein